jgi:hypothetical protein
MLSWCYLGWDLLVSSDLSFCYWFMIDEGIAIGCIFRGLGKFSQSTKATVTVSLLCSVLYYPMLVESVIHLLPVIS